MFNVKYCAQKHIVKKKRQVYSWEQSTTSLTTLAVRIKTNIAKKVCPSFAYGISLCTLDNGVIVFSAPADSKVILMQSLIKTSHLNVHKMNMAAPGNNQSCFI